MDPLHARVCLRRDLDEVARGLSREALEKLVDTARRLARAEERVARAEHRLASILREEGR